MLVSAERGNEVAATRSLVLSASKYLKRNGPKLANDSFMATYYYAQGGYVYLYFIDQF